MPEERSEVTDATTYPLQSEVRDLAPTEAPSQRASVVAGKRCSPALLWVVLGIVLFALVFFAVRQSHNVAPASPPVHQPDNR